MLSPSPPGTALRRTASLPLAYVPAITYSSLRRCQDVDARVEPGHDELKPLLRRPRSLKERLLCQLTAQH